MTENDWWPKIAFGTYKIGGAPSDAKNAEEIEDALSAALDVGYRAFDCAQFYANEDLVGDAFVKLTNNFTKIKRCELYIISKVWPDKIYEGPVAVSAQLKKSISDLKCGYLDLYLVHWPTPGKHIAAYKELENYATTTESNQKLIKHLGISNYTIQDYEELKASGLKIKPYANQFEINPFLYRKRTIEYFQNEGIKLQGYRIFLVGGKNNILNENVDADPEKDDILSTIAKNYPSKTKSNVVVRWAIQKGVQPLPKSKNKSRISENFNVFDFELTEEDMMKLDSLTTLESMKLCVANYERKLYPFISFVKVNSKKIYALNQYT